MAHYRHVKKTTNERESPLSRPPLERMMRIHAAIASGGFPNASSLAKELEVSAKTVTRDIEFMRDRLNLPLEYNGSRFGYGYTEEVDAFPTLQITEGELFALLVAEKALQAYRGSPFEKRLLGAFRKLEQSLPDAVSLNLAEWEQTISFRTVAEPVLNLGVMDTLVQAAARRSRLRIQYRKPNSRDPESRTIDPYHLANVNGDWYLFAFDHLRNAIRTFVPARIQSAKATGETFERSAQFAADNHLSDSFGIHSRQGNFEVAIRFGKAVADYIREKRWHPSQVLLELEDGGVEVRLKLGSLVEVQRWILGWGGDATVLRPPELVASVRAAAQRILDYS